jgi:hypothetical protein
MQTEDSGGKRYDLTRWCAHLMKCNTTRIEVCESINSSHFSI